MTTVDLSNVHIMSLKANDVFEQSFTDQDYFVYRVMQDESGGFKVQTLKPKYSDAGLLLDESEIVNQRYFSSGYIFRGEVHTGRKPKVSAKLR